MGDVKRIIPLYLCKWQTRRPYELYKVSVVQETLSYRVFFFHLHYRFLKDLLSVLYSLYFSLFTLVFY